MIDSPYFFYIKPDNFVSSANIDKTRTSLRKLEGDNMNRYSLRFDWKFNGKSNYWEMVVLSDDSKEYVEEVIKNYQKNNNVEFESPVDLMDAICDEYGWQWEDFYHDIEIEF